VTKTYRLLIVDDHPIVRHGIAQLLGREPDIECALEADDAQAALDLLHGTTVDLVICDISMPGISGIDLVRRLASSRPHLPVLVITMHEESIYAERALSAGARGFITKHEAPDRLLAAVRRILEGGVYMSPVLEQRMLDKALGRTPRNDGAPPALQGLSEREFEVLQMMAQGLTSAEMGERINRSVKSIEVYRSSLRTKLGARSAADLTRLAVEYFKA
jgi:two-component system, NarL family, response regulator NreC